MSGQTRSGATFSLTSQNVASIPCAISVRPLLQAAARRAAERMQQHVDDNDGVPLSQDVVRPTDEEDLELRVVHTRRAPRIIRTAAPPPEAPNLIRTPTTPAQQRRKDAAKRRRAKKRSAIAQSQVPAAYQRSRIASVRASQSVERVEVDVHLKDLPHSQSGSWVGLKGANEFEGLPEDIETLIQEYGWELEEWDGSGIKVFTDEEGFVFLILVGKPTDPDWSAVCDSAANALSETAHIGLETGAFHLDDLMHRRGWSFFAFPVGTSYGGGQQVPGNLVHPKPRAKLARSLLKNEDIRRIAGFQSQAFATFAPGMFSKYGEAMKALHEQHPNISQNFVNSVYPATSFNCGPESVSAAHYDFGNFSCGFCAITALGNFDYRRGGHLKLFNLKKAVQFPSSCSVLLPSAAICHGNSPIQAGESRYSITQYASGGLFRWVAYGCRSGVDLSSTPAGDAKRAEINGGEDVRWLEGLGLFPKYDDLFPTPPK